MEAKLYFRMLLQGWWIILLTTLTSVNISLTISYLTTPQYRAVARFIVSPNASLTVGRDIVNSLDTLDKRSVVATYAEVLDSSRLYSETGEALNLESKTLQAYKRSTIVLPDASVLVLTVEGPNQKIVAVLANSIGQHAIDYARTLNQVYDLKFLDLASPPGEAFLPQPNRDASLAMLLGIVVGAALAILREQILIPIEDLRKRLFIDSSSSAFTHSYLLRLLEQQITQNQISPLAFAIVRLQGLLDLVDILPQPTIDRLLITTTSILRKELRGSDIVGRWDEISFAVFLPDTPGTAANLTLQRIRQALSAPVRLDQIDFELDPIIGIGVRQSDDTSLSLIQRAKLTLEKNKQIKAKEMPFAAEVLDSLGYWDKGVEALTNDQQPPPTSADSLIGVAEEPNKLK